MTVVAALGIAAFGTNKTTASAKEATWVAQAIDQVTADVQIEEQESANQSVLEKTMTIALDTNSQVRATANTNQIETLQAETSVEETEQQEEVVEETTPETTQELATSGYEITVEATAYSYAEAGLSNYTADGTNLISDPNVIAVDPSVIPLGSMVEIPGYGVFRAADTGGAIVGNRIDIHFTTVEQCYTFGRRTLTIRVL